MSDSMVAQLTAPISYTAVRTAYNAVRAVAGGVVMLASIAIFILGGPGAWLALGAGVVMTIDGLARLNRGESAIYPLVLDVTITGAGLFFNGVNAAVVVAGILYTITTALLLLPPPRALAVIGYAALWGVPLVTLDSMFGTASDVFAWLVTGTLMVYVALLLISAGVALHRARAAHYEALESERRSSEIKNEFVSMVSHELRTPLTSIQGFTETLTDSWELLDPGEINEFLTIMHEETTHLTNLVEDILVIPRLDAGHLRLNPEEFDIREETFSTAETIFRESHKEYVVSIPGGVNVFADKVRVNQVLRNLLENARKYGGDQVLIEGSVSGERYKVVISDNGPGVPLDQRTQIFEHFEQGSKGDGRSETGVGLGLPIARKLLRAMNGDLWFEPRFPTGSRFCFTMTLKDITVPETTEAVPQQQGSPVSMFHQKQSERVVG
ncbi:MAG TPA: HAMP domain-containing histidine kinase [Actinobacteria bacterium]|nr:HAMP domain-containing histidine kinase [Actinomycetota bacterium]